MDLQTLTQVIGVLRAKGYDDAIPLICAVAAGNVPDGIPHTTYPHLPEVDTDFALYAEVEAIAAA